MSAEISYFTGFSTQKLKLECGQKLGPVTIAYKTLGALNKEKTNAILVCHALSGDAEIDKWWKTLIGPNRYLDTEKYFIIGTNTIGGCSGSTGPQSTNPETNKPYGADFPFITIGDMVNAQKALIDELGIRQLKMVIGGSMGGMQALEWAIAYSEMVKSCVSIATTPKLSTQALAFDAVGRNAITLDPHWNQGDYYTKTQPTAGLSVARMIGHITYVSEELMTKKFGRNLQKKSSPSYDLGAEFEVESYLQHQGKKFVSRFDANSYLYLKRAVSYFDLEAKYSSLEKAFKHVQSKFLIISISSDWLYTPKQVKRIAKALIKNRKDVTYCNIDSPYGHDAFLIDNPKLFTLIKHFLEKV